MLINLDGVTAVGKTTLASYIGQTNLIEAIDNLQRSDVKKPPPNLAAVSI